MIPSRSEYEEQVAIFKWADLMLLKLPELELLQGSLNGVRLTIGQAVKAKRAGLKKSYPDLFLPVARGDYHGLFIELKKRGSTYPDKGQRQMLLKLREQGYCADWVRGSDDAIKLIKNYLEEARG
ncbi:VRR-NUC domain-containing protein [Thermodesulfobacteriota bacterium]